MIVVETSHLSRLGALAEVAQRQGVEALLFDHHGDRPPDWVDAAHAVLSDDGALSTTMVGILAERGIQPTPAEATALALGIHEDTGSLTYVSTTLRDVEALAFCARHGAAQELIARFLHLPLPEEQRALLTTLVDAAETVDVDGIGVLVTAVALAPLRGRHLDAGHQGHGGGGVRGAADAGRDGRAGVRGRSQPLIRPGHGRGAVAAGRWGPCAGGVGDRPRQPAGRGAPGGRGRAPRWPGAGCPGRAHHVLAGLAGRRRHADRRGAGRVPQAAHVGRARPIRRAAGRCRQPRGSGPRDRARPGPRPVARGDDRGGDRRFGLRLAGRAAPGAADRRPGDRGRPPRRGRRARRRGAGRCHAGRPAAGAAQPARGAR